MNEILGFTPPPLYYISAIAGFVMVVGGMWLIYKEKIYIDRESNTVTEVKTPIGTFKTNIPALLLFLMGLGLMFYPIFESAKQMATVKVAGEFTPQNYPQNKSSIDIYVVVRSDKVTNPGKFNFPVPFLGSDYSYKVLYVVGSVVQEGDEFNLANLNEYDL